MLKLNQIKKSGKFSKFNTADKKQTEAIEQQALEHGRIFQPMFVWEETKQLLYGEHLLKIAQKNPNLEYTVIEVSVETQKDAEVWVTEYLLPQPIHLLWHKLVWAIDCKDYWVMKKIAKQAQGTRNDLHSDSEEKLSSNEVNKIIAGKVGCCPTMVHYFKTVYDSDRTVLIQECEKGEMTISAAYKEMKPKKPKNNKPSTGESKNEKTPPQVFPGWDILNESIKNIDVGNKSKTRSNSTPPDPKPILDKIQKAKVPDGAFWLAFYPDRGVFQLVKKSVHGNDKKVNLRLDAFNCKPIEPLGDVVVFEVDHINLSEETRNVYEKIEFEETDKGVTVGG